MPTGLAVGLTLSLPVLALSTGMLLLALSGFGSFKVDGEPVSAAEFLESAGLGIAVNVALLAPIAGALVARKPWSRPLMIYFWVVQGALSIGQLVSGQPRGCSFDLTWIPALMIAVWYLYYKPNVAAYFKRLQPTA